MRKAEARGDSKLSSAGAASAICASAILLRTVDSKGECRQWRSECVVAQRHTGRIVNISALDFKLSGAKAEQILAERREKGRLD